jgi:hypothetical protein
MGRVSCQPTARTDAQLRTVLAPTPELIAVGQWLCNFMPKLKLNIYNDGDVTLPGEIANSTLTLAEIGALVCFPARFDAEMHAAINSLKDKGVIKASVEGRTVKIDINLESVSG